MPRQITPIDVFFFYYTVKQPGSSLWIQVLSIIYAQDGRTAEARSYDQLRELNPGPFEWESATLSHQPTTAPIT